VVLGANRTTGYAWTLGAFEPGTLTSLGSPVYAQEPAMPGAGGTEIFFFLAARIGRQELSFQYRRAFEPSVPPVKTVSFTVSVR
jgi:inhibitor of cysteine peptidase